MNRGEAVELLASAEIHKKGIALLVSPLILRELGAGQIDVARIEKISCESKISLFEVKSKWSPGKKQWIRLKRSSQFLSMVFNMSSTIQIWQFEKEILPN